MFEYCRCWIIGCFTCCLSFVSGLGNANVSRILCIQPIVFTIAHHASRTNDYGYSIIYQSQKFDIIQLDYGVARLIPKLNRRQRRHRRRILGRLQRRFLFSQASPIKSLYRQSQAQSYPSESLVSLKLFC
jgi:hypothetical protein